MRSTGRASLLAALVAITSPARLGAAPEPTPASRPASAPATLEPPRPLTSTAVPYPSQAPPHGSPVVVRVKILVGPDGLVKTVELLGRSLPVFDEAVLRAARGFRFSPGRYGGQPVPVAITFTHTFRPPPSPSTRPATRGPLLASALRGRLIEMGTRAPVGRATVAVEVEGRRYAAEADDRGRFRLPLPAGAARVSVHAANYHAFLQAERLVARQELAVSYYLERERYDPYEIVIVDERRREEVSRISLRGPELTQVPGTFGDPFRVIQALPGTASVVSLFPLPVVRGASPSSTGFLLDGVRVPLLYHLLAGPSVVHPEFVDEVEFFPGGAPVLYGGYTGGIIDGHTRRVRSNDQRLIDLDVNLLSAGAFVRWPIPRAGITVSGAARYGYPGLVLSLATSDASLSYWDYQLRVDGGNARNGWTLFAYGARDQLQTRGDQRGDDGKRELSPALTLHFHRLDLRLYHGRGKLDGLYRVVTGYDHSESVGSNVETFVVDPSLRWSFSQSPKLKLTWGLEGSLRHLAPGLPPTAGTDSFSLSELTQDLRELYVGSALIEALWRPTSRWLVRPGLRGDVYDDGRVTRGSADVRLTVRYKLATLKLADVIPGSDESAVWLKGAVGLYHQPPRFVLPVPGLDTMPLRYDLLRAVQTSLGVEAPLGHRLSVSVEGYFNYLDPTIFDLAINEQPDDGKAPYANREQEGVEQLLVSQIGRTYGLELMLRRQARDGLYGWLSYTLSRSERRRPPSDPLLTGLALPGGTTDWAPYDFDRTHLVNLVLGLPLPRNWDLGLRLQYQSGRPATTTLGYNAGRSEGYLRIDLRVDKRAVWKSWLLDFYVDLINVALFSEELVPGQSTRYVLPTVGVRGRF